jgi:AcrR family transcriptional regulator
MVQAFPHPPTHPETVDRDGRSIRAQERREARFEAIMRAGESVFAARGFHGTSIADVIEAAEISRGTFYLYFESKESLFHALLDRFVEGVMEVIKVVDPDGDEDPVLQIHANVERAVNLLFDNRELTTMFLREATGSDVAVTQQLDRLHAFLDDMVCGALRNGAQMGLIRDVEPRVIGPAIIGSIKEVLYQYIVLEKDNGMGRKEIALALFEFGLRGLQR